MSDEQPTYRAAIKRCDALGHTERSGEITGYFDFVSANLLSQIESLRKSHPGDRLTITVDVDIPAAHPLAGVDLLA